VADPIYQAWADRHATLYKQQGDIPEVQAVIDLLTPRLAAWWDTEMERAIAAVQQEINRAIDDGEIDRYDEDAILELAGALYIILVSGTAGQPAAGTDGSLRNSTAFLHRAGLLSIPGAAPRPPSWNFSVPVVGHEDILLQLRGRLTTRQDEVTGLLAELVSARTRQDDVNATAALLGVSAALGLRDQTWVRSTTDAWAYRWYNIGGFDEADRRVEQGFAANIVAVNNPPTGPDERTTRFCRWVHGRVLARKRIRRGVEEFAAAVLRGQERKARQFSRLLSSEDARQLGSKSQLAKLGLPPYHWRCRTVVWVQPLI
jgi:hypothetical protein